MLAFSSPTNNKKVSFSSMTMFGQSTHNQPMPGGTVGVPSLDQLIALTNSACHRMETQLGLGLNLRPDGASATGQQSKAKAEPTKPELFKTQLCNHFSIFGTCRFGSGCWFAHGMNELRACVPPAISPSTPSSLFSVSERRPRAVAQRAAPSLLLGNWDSVGGGRSRRQINIFGHGCLFGGGPNDLRASVSGGSSSPPSSLFSFSDRPSRSVAHRAPPSLLLGCDFVGGRSHRF